MLPDYPEVKRQLQEIFDDWLKLRIKHYLGGFGEIPRYSVHEGTATSIIREGGEYEKSPMKEITAGFELKMEEVPNLTLEDIIQRLDKIAQDMAAQQTGSLLEMMSEATKRTGNVVESKGGITPEAILQVYKEILIPFDENGKPELPQMHLGAGIAESAITALKELESNPTLKTELDEIMRQKKEQWRAREADRRLVG